MPSFEWISEAASKNPLGLALIALILFALFLVLGMWLGIQWLEHRQRRDKRHDEAVTARVTQEAEKEKRDTELFGMFANAFSRQTALLERNADNDTANQQRIAERNRIQAEQTKIMEQHGKDLEALQTGVLDNATILKQQIKPTLESLSKIPERIESTGKSLDTLSDVIKTLPKDMQDKLQPDLINLSRGMNEIKTDVGAVKERLSAIENKFDRLTSEIVRAIGDAISRPSTPLMAPVVVALSPDPAAPSTPPRVDAIAAATVDVLTGARGQA